MKPAEAEPVRGLHSLKVQSRHLDRSAVVYVRQSSLQQVLHHQESTRRQYGLQDVAVTLGWSRTKVAVIDEDLGISGASAEGRAGFQRLLGEVALDHVGIILGIEMSRLARSCRDWYQLLELCAVFGTLIGDLDGVYDPSQFNDRLLLGLKGTMSEAELHVIRQRLVQGKAHKARRGELALPLPSGYARLPDGAVALDPDAEVQAAVRTVFAQFERLGTIHATLRELRRAGLRIGRRSHAGAVGAEIRWTLPSQGLITHMLHNPTYAGTYAYGRSTVDPRRRSPGRPASGRSTQPVSQWPVCLRDALPAYITWDTFERNLAQMSANRQHADQPGSARKGVALLQGLVVCGRCGARMRVHARDRRYGRYLCNRAYRERGEAVCQGLSARGLDAEVCRLALAALEPASLEVSMRVAQDIERARAEEAARWDRRHERARYEADRAARQYHCVDPENRLVARSLESAWNEKLEALHLLEQERERVVGQQARALTEEERAQIRALAQDLPALWRAATTTDKDRKEILRQVIDQVVVSVQGDSEWVDASIHWAGGRVTATTVRRPLRSARQLSTFPELQAAVLALRHAGLCSRAIAEQLNAEGWKPPRRATFTRAMIDQLLARTRPDRVRRKLGAADLQPDERWFLDFAREVGLAPSRARHWLRAGHLRARQIGGRQGRWVVWADAAELARLKERARPDRSPEC